MCFSYLIKVEVIHGHCVSDDCDRQWLYKIEQSVAIIVITQDSNSQL